MKSFLVWVICSLFFGWQVMADTKTMTETFVDDFHADRAASTAVWNSVLHYGHPPVCIDQENQPTTDAETTLLPASIFGDGSDGPFMPMTYLNFGTFSGNTLTIDTVKHPALNVTSFYLPLGVTIRPVGTNPLIIRVLGSFDLRGVIDCSGGDGDPVTSDNTSVAHGGTGRCGGGNGGDGGTLTTAPTAGAATSATGGGGATNTAASLTNAGGGGGGGGFDSPPASTAGAAGGGAAGSCVNDPYIATVSGGSGGGGGGAYNFVDSFTSRGGGGGAGGGVIQIYAVGDINVAGSLLARGGNGGSSSSALRSGAGGAGGGGTIALYTPGNIQFNGVINAQRGTAGAVTAPGTGTGGSPCEGRTWLLDNFGAPTGVGAENPAINAAIVGALHYSKGAYTLQSKSYDVRNTNPQYTSFSLQASLPFTSTATLQVAGSNDNFVSDNTGFVAASSVATLAGKRYLKFKVTMQLASVAPNATVPVEIQKITATYVGAKQTDFNFTPACGQLSGPGEFLFLLGLAWILSRLFRRTTNGIRKASAPSGL